MYHYAISCLIGGDETYRPAENPFGLTVPIVMIISMETKAIFRDGSLSARLHQLLRNYIKNCLTP